MVEFINRNEAAIKGFDSELIDGKAEGSVSADQNLVVAFEEGFNGIDLAAVFSRRVAEIPLGNDGPVSPKTEFRKRLVVEA